jgi:alpha-ketoglutarate-dependent taurine dioxygenase
MAITVRKIGYALGAQVSGVDISRPIDDQTFGEINQAFLENCVLVFHDQPLTREQQVAFSRRFGEPDSCRLSSGSQGASGNRAQSALRQPPGQVVRRHDERGEQTPDRISH